MKICPVHAMCGYHEPGTHAWVRDKAGVTSALVWAGSSTCAFGANRQHGEVVQRTDVGVELGARGIAFEGTRLSFAKESATWSTRTAALSAENGRRSDSVVQPKRSTEAGGGRGEGVTNLLKPLDRGCFHGQIRGTVPASWTPCVVFRSGASLTH